MPTSAQLSARSRQPGHDRSYAKSEKNFALAAQMILPLHFDVVEQPSELRRVFHGVGRPLGVVPEVSITHRGTGRKLFVEVKKQGLRGNADERAAKHHTVQFYRTMHDLYGYDYHPFVTVFCESLATDRRYTQKYPYLFEDGQYFLWVDYRLNLLEPWLLEKAQWLG